MKRKASALGAFAVLLAAGCDLTPMGSQDAGGEYSHSRFMVILRTGFTTDDLKGNDGFMGLPFARAEYRDLGEWAGIRFDTSFADPLDVVRRLSMVPPVLAAERVGIGTTYAKAAMGP